MDNEPLNIQIIFVDSDGHREEGPLIMVPSEYAKDAVLDDSTWNKEQTILEFRHFWKPKIITVS